MELKQSAFIKFVLNKYWRDGYYKYKFNKQTNKYEKVNIGYPSPPTKSLVQPFDPERHVTEWEDQFGQMCRLGDVVAWARGSRVYLAVITAICTRHKNGRVQCINSLKNEKLERLEVVGFDLAVFYPLGSYQVTDKPAKRNFVDYTSVIKLPLSLEDVLKIIPIADPDIWDQA